MRITRNAFTLIELLVVIAIISLLVSILLPSLQKAKDLARAVVCLHNLKGIGLAVNLYSTEYEGYFPPSMYEWYDRWYTCPDQWGEESTGYFGKYLNLPQGSGHLDLRGSLLRCPAVDAYGVAIFPADASPNNPANPAYKINSLITGYPAGRSDYHDQMPMHKTEDVMEPARKIVFMDGYGEVNYGTPDLLPADDIPTSHYIGYPHDEYSNAIFADAHAEPKAKGWIDPTDFTIHDDWETGE